MINIEDRKLKLSLLILIGDNQEENLIKVQHSNLCFTFKISACACMLRKLIIKYLPNSVESKIKNNNIPHFIIHIITVTTQIKIKKNKKCHNVEKIPFS